MGLLAALLEACRERPDDDLPRRAARRLAARSAGRGVAGARRVRAPATGPAAGKRGGAAARRAVPAVPGGVARAAGRVRRQVRPRPGRGEAHQVGSGSPVPPLVRLSRPHRLNGRGSMPCHYAAHSTNTSLASPGGPASNRCRCLRVSNPGGTVGDVDWLPGLCTPRVLRPRDASPSRLRPSGAALSALSGLFASFLCLRHCGLTDADVLTLRDAPLLPRLRRPGAPDNHLHAEAAEALATCPGLRGLQVLDLGRNVISADGARRLGTRHTSIRWRNSTCGSTASATRGRWPCSTRRLAAG